MIAYQKERINHTMLFFAQEHRKKTRHDLSQTVLYKYLAFFEFRYLKSYGEMPLELNYKAMEHGPVPIEIYANRETKNYFTLVSFEPKGNGFIIKPKGKFNPDYFAETELKEMRNLIEIFAQQWVGAAVMSNASHKHIRAWRITHKEHPNKIINPIDEFDRNILEISEEELTPQEERYLTHKAIKEFSSC
ncbi:MAG: SocA family protein [Tannerellaceae bacterium]|jgi:hypothetical protein|nr:SocA family protein [Tannerellaceae bacterium]